MTQNEEKRQQTLKLAPTHKHSLQTDCLVDFKISCVKWGIIIKLEEAILSDYVTDFGFCPVILKGCGFSQ